MFKDAHAFGSFSVDDLDAAKKFYGDKLGLKVEVNDQGLMLRLGGGARVFAYPKGPAHEPATFTILNFPVDDIDATVKQLKAKGIAFEHYDSEFVKTDKDGIARGEPALAWFKDPAGNILSVIESSR
jgi:catechol 2,3-dioxygenase-like lactoylglutathione lyase family enzyme